MPYSTTAISTHPNPLLSTTSYGEKPITCWELSPTSFRAEYGYKGVVEQELNIAETGVIRGVGAPPREHGTGTTTFTIIAAHAPAIWWKGTKGDFIKYPPTAREQSFRDLVHEHVTTFLGVPGIDLLIGSE